MGLLDMAKILGQSWIVHNPRLGEGIADHKPSLAGLFVVLE
jgi:hypothetical protein